MLLLLRRWLVGVSIEARVAAKHSVTGWLVVDLPGRRQLIGNTAKNRARAGACALDTLVGVTINPRSRARGEGKCARAPGGAVRLFVRKHELIHRFRRGVNCLPPSQVSQWTMASSVFTPTWLGWGGHQTSVPFWLALPNSTSKQP